MSVRSNCGPPRLCGVMRLTALASRWVMIANAAKGTEGRPAKLQTQIKRRESRRTVEARQHSYTAHAQSLDEDAAVPLRVLDKDVSRAALPNVGSPAHARHRCFVLCARLQDEARAKKVAQLHASVDEEVEAQYGSEYIEKFAQPVPPECVSWSGPVRCFPASAHGRLAARNAGWTVTLLR